MKKIALDIPIKNRNALETSIRILWVGGNEKLATFVHLFPVGLTKVANIVRKKHLNFLCSKLENCGGGGGGGGGGGENELKL